MNNGKLTHEITTQICKYIETGVPAKHACQAVGITEKTYYEWINKGKTQKTGKYSKFSKSIKKAHSHHMAHNAAIIEKAAQNGKWQASAWMLERRHPDEWGNRQYQKIEHSGKIDIELFKQYLDEDDSKPKDSGDNNKADR